MVDGWSRKVATEEVGVDVFSAEVRFLIWLPSEGNKQPRQVCLQQGVCLVQVRGVSCRGVSHETGTSKSNGLRSAGTITQTGRNSLKC